MLSLFTYYFYNVYFVHSEQEQESKFKRAIEYYFNMIDKDQNGIITYPEFTKMALDFCVEGETSTENMVQIYTIS